MTDDHEEIGRLRDNWHDLRTAVDRTNVTVAVIEERQKSIGAQLSRIEDAVTPLPLKLAILEDRQDEARNTAAKWGGALGAFVAALIGGIGAMFGGKP